MTTSSFELRIQNRARRLGDGDVVMLARALAMKHGSRGTKAQCIETGWELISKMHGGDGQLAKRPQPMGIRLHARMRVNPFGAARAIRDATRQQIGNLKLSASQETRAKRSGQRKRIRERVTNQQREQAKATAEILSRPLDRLPKGAVAAAMAICSGDAPDPEGRIVFAEHIAQEVKPKKTRRNYRVPEGRAFQPPSFANLRERLAARRKDAADAEDLELVEGILESGGEAVDEGLESGGEAGGEGPTGIEGLGRDPAAGGDDGTDGGGSTE